MLKKIFVALALMLPFIAGAQTVKIGLIDAQSIVQDMPAFATAQASVKSKAEQFDAELEKLMKEGQTKVQEYEALPKDTPEAVRTRRAQEIQALDQKVAEFQQMAQQELQKAQAEALAPIYQDINNAIQAVGKEGNFTIIQEKAAVLYFGAPAEDITALVRTRLGLKPAAAAAAK